MTIKVGTKINLKNEDLIVTVVNVYGDTARYKGPNGERGILTISKLNEKYQVIVDGYKLEKTGEKVKVDHNEYGKGAMRHLYKDNYGYCIRQHGGFNEVKQDDQGRWFTTVSMPAAFAARHNQ